MIVLQFEDIERLCDVASSLVIDQFEDQSEYREAIHDIFGSWILHQLEKQLAQLEAIRDGRIQ